MFGRYWFALKCGFWLCRLPLLLRFYSLPGLLERITSPGTSVGSASSMEMDQAVNVVVRLCGLRFFRLPFFPRACLKQSLVLYRVLVRMGRPVRIHFGVQRRGSAIEGHSWVTLHGRPIAERVPPETFATVYSYPLQADANDMEVGIFERRGKTNEGRKITKRTEAVL